MVQTYVQAGIAPKVGDRVQMVALRKELPPHTAISERFNCRPDATGRISGIVRNDAGDVVVCDVAMGENRNARCAPGELGLITPVEHMNM